MSKDLDMRMKPYACVATGVNENMEGVGMIEVVLHSDTINNIQRVFFFILWLLFLFSRTHTPHLFFFGRTEREEKTNRTHTVHN